ncbi:MAG: DUF4340 domain-containing protein [Bdellovibrionales bacterium]|nr:DUF4340 domain-containing protein [Bdellovibrionales bacterium]
MKRWLSRFIYFVIVMGTASFAFYQYRQSQEEKRKEEKQDLVFPSLELSQVKVFSIKKGDTYIYVLNQGGEWRLDSPVKDMADRDLVGDWIESLLSEKVKTIKEKGVDWAEYGLDQNVNSIEITTVSGTSLKLDISQYSAFDGKFYIRKEESLLLGNTSWASLTDKQGDYFRSYKALNIGEHPVALHYDSKLFKARLKWDNYNWKWSDSKEGQKKSPALFPLSHSELESYWSSFSNISFEKEVYPNTKGLRSKFKLNKPDIELQLEFKSKGVNLSESSESSTLEKKEETPGNLKPDQYKKWSLKISPEIKGKFYAMVSTRDYIFTLSKEQRERVLLTEQTIRDHHQPFQFKRREAYFIEWKGYDLDMQVKKEKDKWMLVRAEEDKKVSEADSKREWNVEELKNVLNKLSTLSAKKYFDKKKSFVKTASLIIKDKKEVPILKLELSDPFEWQENKNSGFNGLATKGKESKSTEKLVPVETGIIPDGYNKSKMVYVRSNRGQEVMALDFKAVQSIFSSSLLRTNVEQENDNP